jgi:hypothetical protein
MRHEHKMCQANEIKQKVLTGRQSNKKKNRFAFFFSYLFFFTFSFMFGILFYSFSFISTLRTMLCLKCVWRGGGEFWFSLFFLCVLLELKETINIFLKKYLYFSRGEFWFSLFFLCVLLELKETINIFLKKYLYFSTLSIKFYLLNSH